MNQHTSSTSHWGSIVALLLKLVRGKPFACLRAVIILDVEDGDAETGIDSIDDSAPFGFDDVDRIAKLELSIHWSASMAIWRERDGPLPWHRPARRKSPKQDMR